MFIAIAAFLLVQSEVELTDWAVRAAKGAEEWQECLNLNTIRYAANSEEAADVVVEAAFGACSSEQIAIESLYRERGVEPSGPVAESIDRLRPRLTSLVFAARERQAELRGAD